MVLGPRRYGIEDVAHPRKHRRGGRHPDRTSRRRNRLLDVRGRESLREPFRTLEWTAPSRIAPSATPSFTKRSSRAESDPTSLASAINRQASASFGKCCENSTYDSGGAGKRDMSGSSAAETGRTKRAGGANAAEGMGCPRCRFGGGFETLVGLCSRCQRRARDAMVHAGGSGRSMTCSSGAVAATKTERRPNRAGVLPKTANERGDYLEAMFLTVPSRLSSSVTTLAGSGP